MQGRFWRRFMFVRPVSVSHPEKAISRRSRARRAALSLVLITLLPGVSVAASGDDHWSSRYDALGMNAPTYALTDDGNGNIFAGGDFTIAGGDTVNRVARFDGNYWAPYGTGIGGTVHALAYYQGNLIAGGTFTSAGGQLISYIARWDGSEWVALGAGLNGPVDALLVKGTDLYVGGEFTGSGATPLKYIARWDGSSWNAVGSGFGGNCYALAVYNNDLYAGGDFLTAGGGTAKYIAHWTGSAWTALGGGLSYDCFALAAFNGNLYAGGAFATPGVSVARWNGSSWSAMGGGLDSYVTSFDVYNSTLVIGGLFISSSGTPYSHIVRWNGSGFSAMGSGTNDEVFAVRACGASLFAGGAFMQAGLKNSKFVGEWDDVTTGVGDLPFALALDAPVPSPSRGASTLTFRLSEGSHVRLDMIDVRGRLLATLVNGYLAAGPHQAQWNGRDAAGATAPSGIYFARLTDGKSERLQRVVRLGN
jgi:hypothetical protein